MNNRKQGEAREVEKGNGLRENPKGASEKE